MNVAILGPQGCGKGTQAEKLANEFNLVRIETGKILRKIAESESPIAEEVREVMQQGKLVSDEILKLVIKDKLAERPGNGFVFDGTPRDFAQYQLIKEILKEMGQDLDWVIFLKIRPEESVLRLTNRRTCEKCNKIYNLITNPPFQPDKCECGGNLKQREDDTPRAIRMRLEEYQRVTVPVEEAARNQGILIEVDGSQPIEIIHQEIVRKLGLKHG